MAYYLFLLFPSISSLFLYPYENKQKIVLLLKNNNQKGSLNANENHRHPYWT